MKKRIFLCMLSLVMTTIIFTIGTLCAVFYNRIVIQTQNEIMEKADLHKNDTWEAVKAQIPLVETDNVRITLIAPDGHILFDNMRDSQLMNNHLDRQEVISALKTGVGDARRYSETFKEKTLYYAIRIADGTILRTSKTVSSIFAIFFQAIPSLAGFILLFAIVSYIIAEKFSSWIVSPILKFNLNSTLSAPYDELTPYAQSLAKSREQIAFSEQQLEKRIETINTLMDNMDEGVILLDNRGKILSINKSISRIFSLKSSMEGKNILELIRTPDFSKFISEALVGQRNEMIFEKFNREYRLLFSPVSCIGVIVFFLDITKKTEVERLRREFSANISHELKTPLTSIYGYTEMLKENLVASEDKPKFYEKIMAETSRLISLIEDTILLSELDEEIIHWEFESVDLVQVAQYCITTLSPQIHEKCIEIKITGSASMKANPQLIHNMLLNLIENAIKYNHKGGKVDIILSQNETETEIIVSDNGIGIPEKDQPRIFERFYRADKSRSRKSGGTGLGLAIVKHIVLIHGGNISVSSKENQYSKFYILFPKTKV